MLLVAGGAAGATSAAKTCQGRALLQCPEKQAIFADDVDWSHVSVLDFELFETRTPLHLSNRSLATFWRFEASTAAARGALEFVLGSEVTDANFEAIQPIAKLPRPSVPRDGIVDRKTAAALSHLMQTEQREVLVIEALDAALNRATAARYDRGRQDWVNWQLAAAAGFATKTAAAIGRVIPAERAAATALVKHKLLFGVGSEDLKLARRNVRKHGLAPKLVAVMTQLGLTAPLVKAAKQTFLVTKAVATSFSLAELLSAPHTIAAQKAAAAQLRHFAKRIPPASKPPA